ncbi:septal ring lytic transglycosylase RlpA family protein [bacterium]|nr:septal ring lytic transglycosylase RlpA family protein [candidate division CSSED10-310 bacterium]
MLPPYRNGSMNPLPADHLRRFAVCCVFLAATGLIFCQCTPRIPGESHTGTASWYGKEFHGRKTASGERFNMYDLTAAHRTLPFGTKVRVTNLDNNRSVVVTINDRGPFVKNRIIDLSYGAARKLGFVKQGLARVRIQLLD